MTLFSRKFIATTLSGAIVALSAAQALACPGQDYAACMSEEEVTGLVTTYCLAPAGTPSELGEVVAAGGFDILSETKTSSMHVLSYRNQETLHAVDLAATSDGELTCTVTTGLALEDGLDKRLSRVMTNHGYNATGTSETRDGFTMYNYEGGDGVGKVSLHLPDPAFSDTIDVIITRQVSFE